MSIVRVDCFAISIDGYGAGPNQSIDAGLGVGGEELHKFMFATEPADEAGKRGKAIDAAFVKDAMTNKGAWIMGRNMFGPGRGEWPVNDTWHGWWGKKPPYNCPVFVLTHHAREPIAMEGGTTFHFVTDGIHAALERARDAAGANDIRIGGGVSTVRQYLNERLIDRIHLCISPEILGTGESLLQGMDLLALGYKVERHEPSQLTQHVVIGRA